MTADELERWRAAMSFSKAKAAQALGISRQHYTEIVANRQSVPKWASLVCAALYHRIKPWPEAT